MATKTVEKSKKKQGRDVSFPVIIQEDEGGGFVVTNPSLEGCYSQGDTIEEALKNIKEATELCLENTAGQKPRTKSISLHFISLNG